MKANDIAVLYFDDRSPDRSLRYLSDGLTEALIHELGTVKALHVTSRNGVAPFKGKDIGPDSIAKALSVGTIVSGTVAQSGDKVRVTVEMLDARTGGLDRQHVDREDQGRRVRPAGHAGGGGVGGAAEADRPAGAGAHQQGRDAQRRGVGSVPAREADGDAGRLAPRHGRHPCRDDDPRARRLGVRRRGGAGRQVGRAALAAGDPEVPAGAPLGGRAGDDDLAR